MTALAAARNTKELAGAILAVPVKATTRCYQGGIAVLNAGYAAPGTTTTGLVALGRFEEDADNSVGQNGDITVRVKRGVFQFANSSSGDAIAQANVGSVCYIVDDQTVAKTANTNTRSPAGIVEAVDSGGVWVRMGYELLVAPALSLLAASNLSDLGNAATARGNLGGGANKMLMEIRDIDLVGANTEVKRVVSPIAGAITKIYSVIDGALTTGDAILTAKIGTTAITNGAITVAQSGSTAGDVDSATPTAANTLAAGNVLSITVGGANDAAILGHVIFLITPSA